MRSPAGRTYVLLAGFTLMPATACRAEPPRFAPALELAGGWTDNMNGGGDRLPEGLPANPDEFAIVRPGLRAGGRLSPSLGWEAGCSATGELLRHHPGSSSLLPRVDGGGFLETGRPRWDVQVAWLRKDYRDAARDPVLQALEMTGWRLEGGVTLPLTANRSTSLVGSVGWEHSVWPHEAGGGAPEPGRTDVTTTARGGVEQAIGSRARVLCQLQYAANASTATVWRAGRRLDRWSYRAPGAMLGVGLALNGGIALTGAAQYQARRFNEWEEATARDRERGSVAAAALRLSWAAFPHCLFAVDWSLLRYRSSNPGETMNAQRATLGTTLSLSPS